MHLTEDNIRYLADLPASRSQTPFSESDTSSVSDQQIDTPTMTSTIEAKFEAEERMLLAKLEFFKDVKAKKAAIEEIELLISSQSLEYKKLEKRLAVLLDDIDIGDAEYEDLVTEHAMGKAAWVAKSSEKGYGFYSFRQVTISFGAGKENDVDLDAAVKLTVENAALLKQLAEIQKLAKVLAHRKSTEKFDLVSNLEEVKEVMQDAEESLNGLRADHEAALEKWEKHKADYTSFSNKRPVQDAFKKGLELGRLDATNLWSPLATAGMHVRGRKLEWVKTDRDSRNEWTVEDGNQASHYGMAVADATLYQDFCPQKRTDVKTYIELYSLEPDYVWSHRTIQELSNVLDWRGGMKDFCAYGYKNVAYERHSFHVTLLTFLQVLKTHNDRDDDSFIRRYFLNKREQYLTLRGLYESSLDQHKAHLKNRNQ